MGHVCLLYSVCIVCTSSICLSNPPISLYVSVGFSSTSIAFTRESYLIKEREGGERQTERDRQRERERKREREEVRERDITVNKDRTMTIIIIVWVLLWW